MIEVQSAMSSDKLSCAGEQARRVAARIASVRGSRDACLIVGTFDTLLRRLERTAWPELLWRFSFLCSDQCPVEFTFSSGDDVVRYTTEVAGPELGEHFRLDAACECLEELGLELPPTEILHEWRMMQANWALRWGTWLGIRHDGNGRKAKLYLEIPRERRDWGPRPLTLSSRLHMIGFDPSTGTTEHYFRTSQPDDIDHLTLLRSFRERAHWPLLLESISELRQMPGEAALRWTKFGYSLRQGLDATELGGLTLFLDSEACGGPVRIRKHVLDTMSGERTCVSTYAALLVNLPEERLPGHGVVGIAVDASGKVELRVGISVLALGNA